jgi:hypothetical protein
MAGESIMVSSAGKVRGDLRPPLAKMKTPTVIDMPKAMARNTRTDID